MKYKLTAGCKMQPIADEAVITLKTGDVVVLNGSAAEIVQVASRSACSLEEVAAYISDKYGVAGDVALDDVRRAFSRLRSVGIIEPNRTPEEIAESRKRLLPIARRDFVAGMLVAGAGLFIAPRAFGAEPALVAAQAYGDDLLAIEEMRGANVVTDSLGRRVSVPKDISRVAGFGPFALAMLTGIDPCAIVHVNARGMHALPARDRDLEAHLESMTPRGDSVPTFLIEEAAPDLIVDIATSEGRLSAAARAAADKAGVPILHMVVRQGDLAQAYRSLGKILGRPRANELADFAARIQATLAQGKEAAAVIGKRKLYFGTGPCGFSTRGKGTLLNDIVSSIGAENVAASLIDEECQEVSFPQILDWNPDIAIVAPTVDDGEPDQSRIIRQLWGGLAERESVVVRHAPTLEYDWVLNSPLGLMTVGALWLANAVYPEVYDYDVEAVANDCLDAFFRQSNVDLGEPADASLFNSSSDESGLAERKVASERYAAPSVDVISANALNATASYMSSGGGGGYIPGTTHVTTHRYYAYFMVASASVASLGHAELGLRDEKLVDGVAVAGEDRVRIYSFSADPGSVISDIVGGVMAGVPGDVSSVSKRFSHHRYVTSVTSLNWADFKADPEIYEDKTYSYEPDSLVDALDKVIWIRISETQYYSMRSAANNSVSSSPPQGIDLNYAILQNNCGNFVDDVFRSYGNLTINYDAAASIAYAEGSIGVVALWMIAFATGANLPAAAIGTAALEAILNGLLVAASVDGSVPMIPNGVYNYFQGITGSSYGSGTATSLSSC